MTSSRDLTIGIATALGILFANLLEPRVAAVLAIAALAWLVIRTPKAEVRQVLSMGLVALIVAAAISIILR